MIYLIYIGNHKKDTLPVRVGWAITRLVQTGEFKRATHVECIHEGLDYRSCTIASSSARDGGVRTKVIHENAPLTKGHWMAFYVAEHELWKSKRWFAEYNNEPYSWIGAVATKLTFLQWLTLLLPGFFCNWACLAAFIPSSYKDTPSQSCERLVRDHRAIDITEQFFRD